MAGHPFRFRIVGSPRGTGEQWLATARRTADLGYGTLLVPDGLGLHAPFPSLAVAAAVPGPRVARSCWRPRYARRGRRRGRATA